MEITHELTLDAGTTAFAPNRPINGKVRISSESSWQAEYANLCLEWFTEGRGDQDRRIAASIPIVEPGAAMSPSLSRNFSIMTPAMPWSYAGKIIKLNWCIAIYIKPTNGSLLSYYQDIVIHPAYESR